ncbi:unnamed protein product [Cyclocybe aegerita]|uniref:Aspartic peptidase DDI1-type domain-containing protein n=1 Tax=Cyclocybe aegerita TaxID=1973307 RepID=A0A8S0WA35_CYCAE|nr:unnamed protein product [Cyclocybe aegerita]
MATKNRFAALKGTMEQGTPAQASAYFMEIESAACRIEDLDFEEELEGETIAEEELNDSDAETLNELTPEDKVRNMTYKEMAQNIYDPDGQGKVGDPLSTQVEFMLESMRPYPGDPSWESKVNDRFCVYSVGESKLCILDEVTGEQEILEVSKALRPDFLVGRWYAIRRTQETRVRVTPLPRWHKVMKVPWDCWKNNVAWRLSHGSDFSSYFVSSKEEREEMERFEIRFDRDLDQYHVIDWQLELHFPIGVNKLMHPQRNIRVWYSRQIKKGIAAVFQMDWLMSDDYGLKHMFEGEENESAQEVDDNSDVALDIQDDDDSDDSDNYFIELNAAQMEENVLPAVQRNAALTQDPSRIVPNPIRVAVKINGNMCNALIDTGSLCDFMSSTVADQLRLKKKELATPLMVQLAVLGSCSKVNFMTNAQFEYQGVNEPQMFDIINLSSYDLILGTPFLYQHSCLVGFNPDVVIIRSLESLPVRGSAVRKLASRTAALREENLEEVREYLRELAAPLCKTAAETDLPPL